MALPTDHLERPRLCSVCEKRYLIPFHGREPKHFWYKCLMCDCTGLPLRFVKL